MLAPFRQLRLVVAVAGAAAALGSVPAQAAGPGSGAHMLPTTWTCTNGDNVSVNLPPVAISPGQGTLTAPFPGFMTAVSGPVAMPLGIYVVLAAAGSPAGPFTYFGQKTGLAAGAATCTLDGTPITVTIAPAG